jgi:predicted MPP superfamily phosphohydrolase
LFRAAERSFWSLNSLAVQPGYVLAREGLRHLAEGFLASGVGEDRRARLRAFTAFAAGLGAAIVAVGFAAAVWPATRWSGEVADLTQPWRLVVPTLANTAAVMSGYFAIASLVWGVADAWMDQPRDLDAFDEAEPSGRQWRIAHLSDIHVVGERYGFRIERGRAGPRGNDRFRLVLERLSVVHAEAPLDVVLITGDMTDAGRSAEWAEFLDALAGHPELAVITLVLPGNHDVNIVDRANPARLELPGSSGKRLRQMRMLSVTQAVQGGRVRVVDKTANEIGVTLSKRLDPHRAAIAAFADAGGLRLSRGLSAVWEAVFPMVLPPAQADGLGVVLLNSNAETHFSFTNALGLVAEEDLRATLAALAAYPEARWIVALHHHPVEYPRQAKAFSERIGTALINGSRFVRQLGPHAHRLVVMHGHRHIDWIGRCGRLRIISAPSPVMEAMNHEPTAFYIHALAAADDGSLALLAPERIEITPAPAEPRRPRLPELGPEPESRRAPPPSGSLDAGHRMSGGRS